MSLGFNSSPEAGMSDTLKRVTALWYLLVIVQLESPTQSQENTRIKLFPVSVEQCSLFRDSLDIRTLSFPMIALFKREFLCE